ncbi:Protein CBR-XBP-1 [Caenorhabditis briggsae]|uniref:X-box-binding protein 1 n=1 Tax=Caenorhabditis briggsae TaxID=6238 RepID=A8XX98_CAEBR|nr:Protein CBR-XBP-1 [Caenorhabditis briggsae]CAP37267.2 Protein CBR-XBP-1 [Caenorhabditis briggsae]
MSNYPKRIYVLPARQPRVASTYQNMAPPPPVMRAPKRAISTDQIVAELLGDDMGPSGPRKRERLNHLTQEEKMDRRKFKNRVAAQNARDKKKERSGKIDEVMRKLVEENNRLRAENEKLRRQNEKFQSRQQQQMQIVNEQSSPVMYQNENIVSDSTIYSNVAYEEEVVGEEEDVIVSGGVMEYGEDQRALNQQNSLMHPSRGTRPTDSPPAPSSPTPTSTPPSNTVSPSEEFDRFVADYIEEGGDCSSSSAASGSPSQTRETFSPCASLTMSPSMSCNSSNNDWNDDFFLPNESCETSTETIEEDPLLTDPGNWNFENFDEDSIDLNFFNN